MSALEAIGAFGEGFTGGVQRGMDIYDRFQTMQDAGIKRQRTQRVEQRVKDLMDQGGFDDQASGLDATANFWLDEGDVDEAVKYSQAARQIRQADVARETLNAYAIGQRDPIAGFDYLNKANEKAKNGVTYQVTPLGEGFQIATTANGRTSLQPVKNKDELEHYFLQQAEPMAFGDLGKFGEFQKTKEEANRAAAQAAVELPKAQAEIDKNVAQTGKYEAQAAAEGPKARAQIARDVAGANLANAQAGQVGKPTPESIADVVNSTQPKAGDFGLDEGVPYSASAPARSQVAASVHAANPHLSAEEAVGIGDQLLQTQSYQIDPDAGTAHMPGGVVINIGPAALAQIAEARRKSMVAPEE